MNNLKDNNRVNMDTFYGIKYWHILLCLIALSFSLRIGRSLLSENICKDGVHYLRITDHLQNGERATVFCEDSRMPPLYFYMISITSSILHTPLELTARWISIFAGALLIIPFYFAVRLVFGDKAAVIGGLIVAVHPSLVKISVLIMRDPLFLFLLTLSLYFYVKAIKSKKWSFCFWGSAGFFAGLTTSVRSEGVELVFAAILFAGIFFITKVYQNRSEWKRVFFPLVGNLLLTLLTFSVVLVVMYNSVQGTRSRWSPLDKRIYSFVQELFTKPTEEILKNEDKL